MSQKTTVLVSNVKKVGQSIHFFGKEINWKDVGSDWPQHVYDGETSYHYWLDLELLRQFVQAFQTVQDREAINEVIFEAYGDSGTESVSLDISFGNLLKAIKLALAILQAGGQEIAFSLPTWQKKFYREDMAKKALADASRAAEEFFSDTDTDLCLEGFFEPEQIIFKVAIIRCKMDEVRRKLEKIFKKCSTESKYREHKEAIGALKSLF